MDIKELRSQTGLSQGKFAKKFHLNVRSLQRWEQGQNKTPECILYMIETILSYEAKGEENGNKRRNNDIS